MLQPGGQILYSTCTFAPAEDEEVISWLLKERPDLFLVSMEDYEGFSAEFQAWGERKSGAEKMCAYFPHKMAGEGHFLALLKKEGQAGAHRTYFERNSPPADAIKKYLEEFFREIGLKSLGGQPIDWNRMEVRADKVYYLPPYLQLPRPYLPAQRSVPG